MVIESASVFIVHVTEAEWNRHMGGGERCQPAASAGSGRTLACEARRVIEHVREDLGRPGWRLGNGAGLAGGVRQHHRRGKLNPVRMTEAVRGVGKLARPRVVRSTARLKD